MIVSQRDMESGAWSAKCFCIPHESSTHDWLPPMHGHGLTQHVACTHKYSLVTFGTLAGKCLVCKLSPEVIHCV